MKDQCWQVLKIMPKLSWELRIKDRKDFINPNNH